MARKTLQAALLRSILCNTSRPLAPLEILAAGQAAMAGLGIATVYRYINVLLEEGVIKAVPVPGDITRYEPTGLPHHHHFLCTTCTRLFDVPHCPADIHHLCPQQFRVEGHEVLLYGSCKDCLLEG